MLLYVSRSLWSASGEGNKPLALSYRRRGGQEARAAAHKREQANLVDPKTC